VRFEGFTAVKIQVELWVVMPCSVVTVYQHFRDPCCLHFFACVLHTIPTHHFEFNQP